MPESTPSLVLVSVGNTRTRFAPVLGGSMEPSLVLVNDDPAAVAAGIADACANLEEGDAAGEATVVMASVNHPAADQIEAALRQKHIRTMRFGRDLEIPILHTLDESGAETVGQDRLLDALGAFARSTQACIVIDAGTAITVDFVDGQGTFHGGAIAPGVNMMLRALHEQTAALPMVSLTRDLLPPSAAIDLEDDEDAGEGVGAGGDGGITTPHAPGTPAAVKPPFGKNTTQAIAYGVASAVRGLVHELIDRYAEFYKAYPRVVATGGDAALLLESDLLIEAIVPDLTLIGMLEAVKRLEKLDEHGSDE